jgi:hypothetical protein
VLAYLARYTHRVAIANSRLLELTDDYVAFRWKDYRTRGRAKVMHLSPGEFMRRFLMHVLPARFHRIRHFGLFANAHRADNVARCLTLLADPDASTPKRDMASVDGRRSTDADTLRCPCCGGRMAIVESFESVFGSRASKPRGFDSS